MGNRLPIIEIYEEALDLSAHDREVLITLLERSLADEERTTTTHSITELRGLGKEVWQGLDGQQYVNKLRDEWDHRP